MTPLFKKSGGKIKKKVKLQGRSGSPGVGGALLAGDNNKKDKAKFG